MRIPTIAQIENALLGKGWKIHREPHRLNIVILRRTPGTHDLFDDMIVVIYTAADGTRRLWAARCTADPGKPARERPTRKDGTGVWAVSQQVDGFALGDHHPGTPGAYTCFRPQVPIPVLRYTSIDDLTGTPSTSTQSQIHRANATRESTVVGDWSTLCTVVANPTDYAALIALAREQECTGFPRFTVGMLEWNATASA
jgi:hypothetical protein